MTDEAVAPGDATSGGGGDRDAAAARRAVLLLVAALATAAGAALVLLVGAGGGDDDPDTAGGEPIAAIGPGPGIDVAGYASARADVLAALDGRAAAVVSFTEYVPAARVDEQLGPDLRARALLVALPAGLPAITTDPSRFRADARAEAETQITEISGLLPSVDDGEFADFYRSELLRYEQVVANAERADIVYAAVVEAAGPQLRALATRPGVRLVDAVGGATLVPDARITGLRPEETARTGAPEFRPT